MAQALQSDSPSQSLAPTSIESIMAQLGGRGGELKAKEEQAEQKIESAEASVADMKPPELQPVPPPVAQSTDPKEIWGSSAMLLAGLGSLLTRRPLTTALNAAGQVLTAYKQKDQAAANQAFETWKVANENAMKIADFQMNAYKAALAKADHDEKGALAEFTAAAHAFQDETAVQEAQIHGIEGIQHLMMERERLAVSLQEAGPKLVEGHAFMSAFSDLQKKPEFQQADQAGKLAQIADLANSMKTGSAGKSVLSDDDLRSMAEQYLAGDKTVLQGLGYGNAGAANRARLQHVIREVANENGMSGADIAAAMAEFQGTTAGERTLGTTAARIGLGAAEMETLIPQVQEASKELPRGQYPTMNAFIQASERETGNPKLRNLAVRLQGLKSAYSQVLTRGGVPTDSARAAADELFSTKDPETVLQTALQAIQQETAAIKAAPGMVRGELREGLGAKLKGSSPKVGSVEDGYRFKGGDASDPKNWEKVK